MSIIVVVHGVGVVALLTTFTSPSIMSSELLNAVKAIVPPLVHASHKGLAGRVGIIGGSLE